MTVTPEHLQELADEVEVGPRPEDPYAEQSSASSAVDVELQSLGPGDHVRLASLLRAYPDQQQYILSVAATRCGNSTVQRALAMIRNGEGAPPSQQARDDVALDVESSHAQESRDDATQGVRDVEKLSNHSPAWTRAARDFNAAHSHLVAEFNTLTDGYALINGELDLDAVGAWQTLHGLNPDGKVGPLTIAAAKRAAAESKASEEPVAAGPEPTDDDNLDGMNGSAPDWRTQETT
jgi:hypothetical protein